jgi:hypothetical protein
LIRGNGKVEKFKQIFDRLPHPDGVDDRAYYLTAAMNAVAKEGFEVAAMTPDEVVMKRTVPK